MAFWQIFQRAADKIDEMDFSPETKKKLKEISDALPEKIKRMLVDKVLWLCTTAMKKYGKDFVKVIFAKIMDFLKTSLEDLKDDK